MLTDLQERRQNECIGNIASPHHSTATSATLHLRSPELQSWKCKVVELQRCRIAEVEVEECRAAELQLCHLCMSAALKCRVAEVELQSRRCVILFCTSEPRTPVSAVLCRVFRVFF